TTEPSIIDRSFLNGVVSSFSMILTSELLDKSFFIAVVMAMKHSRLEFKNTLCSKGNAAVAFAVTVGLLTAFVPRSITYYLSAALMICFAIKIASSITTLVRVFTQTFGLTVLAEWGDRSQVATVLLAATDNVAGVLLGGVVAYALSTGIAVLGGRLVAERITVRTVTIIGGVVFLLFAVLAL
ncbi:hypothetical protein PMAYCL1PPCAC_16444, partial [Pristionchus mayeri]